MFDFSHLILGIIRSKHFTFVTSGHTKMSDSKPDSPALSSDGVRSIPQVSQRSRCKVCQLFIPAWESHGLCYKHRLDCASNNTCEVCKDWPMQRWADLVLYIRKCLDKKNKEQVKHHPKIESDPVQPFSPHSVVLSPDEDALSQENKFSKLYSDMFEGEDFAPSQPLIQDITFRGEIVPHSGQLSPQLECLTSNVSVNTLVSPPVIQSIDRCLDLEPELASVEVNTSHSVLEESKMKSLLRKWGFFPDHTKIVGPGFEPSSPLSQMVHVPSFQQPNTFGFHGSGKPSDVCSQQPQATVTSAKNLAKPSSGFSSPSLWVGGNTGKLWSHQTQPVVSSRSKEPHSDLFTDRPCARGQTLISQDVESHCCFKTGLKGHDLTTNSQKVEHTGYQTTKPRKKSSTKPVKQKTVTRVIGNASLDKPQTRVKSVKPQVACDVILSENQGNSPCAVLVSQNVESIKSLPGCSEPQDHDLRETIIRCGLSAEDIRLLRTPHGQRKPPDPIRIMRPQPSVDQHSLLMENTKQRASMDWQLPISPLLFDPEQMHVSSIVPVPNERDNQLAFHRDSDIESIGSDAGSAYERRESLTFAGRLKLVWSYLSHLLPDANMTTDTNNIPRSLLTTVHDQREQCQWLPLAPMIRTWLLKYASIPSKLPTSTFNYSSGKYRHVDSFFLPKLKKFRRFYQCMSEDFTLFSPSLSSAMQSEIKGKTIPNVSLAQGTVISLDEHCRLSLSAASSKEWLLATLGHLLKELLAQLHSGTATISDSTDVITTCLELLDSVGKASETEAGGISFVLHTLTLAKRDTILKVIDNLSQELKLELRNAPIIWKQHGTPDIEDDDPRFLFRGLDRKIKADREVSTQTNIQRLLLQATHRSNSYAPKRRSSEFSAASSRKKSRNSFQSTKTLSNHPFRPSEPSRPSDQRMLGNLYRGRGGYNRAHPSSRGSFKSNSRGAKSPPRYIK